MYVCASVPVGGNGGRGGGHAVNMLIVILENGECLYNITEAKFTFVTSHSGLFKMEINEAT